MQALSEIVLWSKKSSHPSETIGPNEELGSFEFVQITPIEETFQRQFNVDFRVQQNEKQLKRGYVL